MSLTENLSIFMWNDVSCRLLLLTLALLVLHRQSIVGYFCNYCGH